MIGNMALEDIMAMLAEKGTVTLRKAKDPVSASGQSKESMDHWTCEISLAGYHNVGYMRSYVTGTGKTASEAASQCLDNLETFLHGPEGATDRARYEANFKVAAERFRKASFDERNHGYNPVRDPGRMAPPLTE